MLGESSFPSSPRPRDMSRVLIVGSDGRANAFAKALREVGKEVKPDFKGIYSVDVEAITPRGDVSKPTPFVTGVNLSLGDMEAQTILPILQTNFDSQSSSSSSVPSSRTSLSSTKLNSKAPEFIPSTVPWRLNIESRRVIDLFRVTSWRQMIDMEADKEFLPPALRDSDY